MAASNVVEFFHIGKLLLLLLIFIWQSNFSGVIPVHIRLGLL